MDEHGDSLTRARRAYAAQDWRSAAAHFDAVPPERLTADDLAAYADAVWWLGRIEDNLRLGAAAYDAFLADSRPAEAARTAMWSSASFTFREATSRKLWAGWAAPDVWQRGSRSARCTGTCSASPPWRRVSWPANRRRRWTRPAGCRTSAAGSMRPIWLL